MKKAICFTILIGCVFFLPSVAVAQSPTGKGITQEGIKRGNHLQRRSPTEILSLIAPSTDMSLEELQDLYRNGSITMHNVRDSNGMMRVEIHNFGTLITTLPVKCNTCGQGGPLLSVPTGTGTRF